MSLRPLRRPRAPGRPFFKAFCESMRRRRMGLEKRIGTSEKVSQPPVTMMSAWFARIFSAPVVKACGDKMRECV